MLMPVLRLLFVYALAALAVVAVVEREAVGHLVFGPGDPPVTVAAQAPEPQQAVARPTMAEAAGAGQIAALQTPVVDAPAAQAAPDGPVYPEPPMRAVLGSPEAEAPADTTAAIDPAAATETLADARRAYWSGDTARAAAILTALAAARPGDAELLGELGNLQFAQRDLEGAGESYLRAGLALVRQGQAARAQPLVAVLARIDPGKSAALLRALQGQ